MSYLKSAKKNKVVRDTAAVLLPANTLVRMVTDEKVYPKASAGRPP